MEVESWVVWLPAQGPGMVDKPAEELKRKVRSLRKVRVRAIPHENRGRSCEDRKGVAYTRRSKSTIRGGDAEEAVASTEQETTVRARQSWKDLHADRRRWADIESDEEDEVAMLQTHGD